MSDHDILASGAIKLKRQLEQYIDEYAPENGHTALTLIAKLVMVIDKFPDDEARPL